MKKCKKQLIISAVAFLFVLIFAIALIPQDFTFARATTNYDEAFFSNANTYDATITTKTERGTDYTYGSVSYDMDHRRAGVTVSTSAPQVTFVTHGLEGTAGHWSNNGKTSSFAYMDNSLIKLLEQKADCNLYLAKFTGWNEFTLMKIDNDDYTERKSLTDNRIIDNSKHSVVIFEAHSPGGSNDFVYTQFNIMASTVVASLQALDANNRLPRVNLIGHSRGGLTNLQYAMDHPELVDSVFSLGTPYVGSTSAEIEHFLLGDIISSNSPGKEDIVDYNIYNGYMNRWNNNYDRLYSDIKVYAMGGYQSLDFLIYELLYSFLPKNEPVHTSIKLALKLINVYISTKLFWTSGKVSKYFIQKAVQFVKQVLNSVFPEFMNQASWVGGVSAALELLFSEIDYNFWAFSSDVLNDGLVDLPSQLGESAFTTTKYRGFNRMQKRFSIVSEANLNKSSEPSMPRVTHNLEAMDGEMLARIVKNINMDGSTSPSPYLVLKNKDDTLSIVGYIGNAAGDTLTIPKELLYKTGNGSETKTVTKITEGAFANDFNGAAGIKHVVLPDTITEIGERAFYENKNLESVTMQQNVTRVGGEAFSGCSSLQSISLPDSVTEIGEGAFENSGLTSFNVPRNMSMIMPGAFRNCENLTDFSITQGNRHFSVKDGVLYDAQKTILNCYPAGKNAETYQVPETVGMIAEYAIFGNQSLKSLDLANVAKIEHCGIGANEALGAISGSDLLYADVSAFQGTKWLTDRAEEEFVALGDALIFYRGSAADLDLSDYATITNWAFSDNSTLESVTFGDKTNNIGDFAFAGCENLKRVNVYKTNGIVQIGTSVYGEDSAIDIFVPRVWEENYRTHDFWKEYDYQIKPKTTVVRFDANGGTDCADKTVYFNDPLGELPVPQRTGYLFKGWEYRGESGTVDVDMAVFWKGTDDEAVFTAKWEPAVYTVSYFPNNGVLPDNAPEKYTIVSGVTFAIPTRTGYTFDGWYTDSALTRSAGQGVEAGQYGDVTLYAKWSQNTYVVSLDKNDDGRDPAQLETTQVIATFNDSSTKFPVPTRNGYLFEGWVTESGELYVNEHGDLFRPWQIDRDVTLRARWLRKQFYIQINDDGSISWLGEDKITSEKTPIPYGMKFFTEIDLKRMYNPNNYIRAGYIFKYFEIVGGDKLSWDSVPDLGANGTILEIYPTFQIERNFSINYLGYLTQAGVNPLVASYNDRITLMAPEEIGKTFEYWEIANVADNDRFKGTPFAPGTQFNYTNMPDLSYQTEEEGTHIYLRAVFKNNRYEITFTSQYGTAPGKQTIEYDTKTDLNLPSQVAGRTFDGWYTGPNKTGTRITNAYGTMLNNWSVAEDRLLYAGWSTNNYVINYVLNGGSLSGERNTYTIDSATYYLPTPTKAGYRFVGWYKDSAFKNYVSSVPMGSTGDKTFYAQWSEIYTISYYDSNTLLKSEKRCYGDTFSLPDDYQKLHYRGTWYDGSSRYDFGASYTYSVERDVRMTLIWERISYSIWESSTYMNQTTVVLDARGESASGDNSITFPKHVTNVVIYGDKGKVYSSLSFHLAERMTIEIEFNNFNYVAMDGIAFADSSLSSSITWKIVGSCSISK